MEKKKVKLSIVQVLLIMFFSALISVILFAGIFYIVNSLTKGNEKNAKEITNSNLLEGYKELTEVSDRFVISSYNEDSNGYTLDTHILEDTPRRVSLLEIEELLKGKTIKFRGVQWGLKDSLSRADKSNYCLGKVYTDDDNYLLISNSLNNNETTYTFRENNGIWNKLCDYKSDEIYEFKVDKDVKVGNTNNKFYYNEDTSEVIVTDSSNNILTNSEEKVEMFFESLVRLDESTSSNGECIAYFLNDEIVAIQTFTATNQ